MNARKLVDSIFRRDQPGVPADTRRITREQYDYLRDLIVEEEKHGTVEYALDGSIVWTAPGGERYTLRENRVTFKHSLHRSLVPASDLLGSFFG